MCQALNKEQNAWHPTEIHSKGERKEEDQGKSCKNNVCEKLQVRNKSEDSVLKMFRFPFKISVASGISIANVTMIFF